MASSSDNISMAVFCDFENVALGVRDANYEKFDIRPVLERLLLKGSIVVKKSYCDWDRYKAFKAPMHEANFELIEIPHVRQSGKNSADIRLVVDALDLCYTKSHVNTFVIISGDSDFSPLVSKLRENNKQVIGVGVKQSTSDLLVANCDEFIFYDDLVREQRRTAAKRDERKAQPQSRRSNTSAGDDKRKEELEARKLQALDMVVETFDALVSERGDTGKIWASLLKDTLKRRRPDFSETYYGFRTFGNLLEEAQTRGLFEFGRDEKSGTFVYRSANAPATLAGVESVIQDGAQASEAVVQDMLDAAAPVEGAPDEQAKPDTRRGRGRGGRKGAGRGDTAQIPALLEPVAADTEAQVDEVVEQPAEQQVEQQAEPEAIEQPASQPTLFAVEAHAMQAEAPDEAPTPKERRRAPRKPSAKKLAEQAALEAAAAEQAAAPAVVETPAEPQLYDGEESDEAIDAAAAAKLARYNPDRPAAKAPARKAAARKDAPRKDAPRSRRPAKPKAGSEKG